MQGLTDDGELLGFVTRPIATLAQDDDSGDLMGADASAILARALVEAAAPVTDETARVMQFARIYAGAAGDAIVRDALSFKLRQAPGAIKRIMEAISALSLKEHFSRVSTMGGGK